MQKFTYNNKTYIKIKQDWYSEIGQKQPLKLAVTLDALFNEMLIENEQSIVKLLDQTRHYLDIGSNKRAYEVILEVLELATGRPEQTKFLPNVLIMYANVIKANDKTKEGIKRFKEILQKEGDIDKNPQVLTAMASLYLDNKEPENAIEFAHRGMLAFRKSKRKVSDELMIVWSDLKKDYPNEHKAYRESIKKKKK